MYFDIVKRNKLSKLKTQVEFHEVNMSLDNKEADALKFAQAEKEASLICQFTGHMHASPPTNFVYVTSGGRYFYTHIRYY